jgi:hypothetical protein
MCWNIVYISCIDCVIIYMYISSQDYVLKYCIYLQQITWSFICIFHLDIMCWNIVYISCIDCVIIYMYISTTDYLIIYMYISSGYYVLKYCIYLMYRLCDYLYVYLNISIYVEIMCISLQQITLSFICISHLDIMCWNNVYISTTDCVIICMYILS